MGEVTFDIIIAMSRADAWEKLRDLRCARHYVPGVTAIEMNTAQREGVGASRKVFMKNRSPVDETAIAWEDQHGYTLNLHNGDKPPTPFKRATFQYLLEDAPGAQTRVRGTFSYEMAPGLLGRMLEALVLRRALKRSNTAVAANMKRFYETGQV
jgi:polyketide cyclase/dehydrase/lipid transport protein